ncbi:MAG: hypothetical protein V3T31_11555, partial [candidate division Zixibacteria bacterium]
MARLTGEFGDAVRALERLCPRDAHTLELILQTFGLTHAGAVATQLSSDAVIEKVLKRGRRRVSPLLDPEADLPKSSADSFDERAKAGDPTVLTPLISSRQPIELRDDPQPAPIEEICAHYPLFTPTWQNGLLVEIMSDLQRVGDVDIEELIERMA